MTAEGLETEKKYDVDAAAALPDLAAIPGVGRVGDPHQAELEAVYFDTEDLVLASRRITLRRRSGGADAGWHVKLPPEAGAGAGAGTPPRRRKRRGRAGRSTLRWARPTSFPTSCLPTCTPTSGDRTPCPWPG